MKSIVIVILCAFAASCSDPAQKAAQRDNPRITKVAVEKPGRQDIEVALTALGSIESIDDPTVSAETSGQVQQIVAGEGDAVTAGQLLATLDGTLHAIETAKAAAEVRRYDVLVENQESEVKRLQRLDESQSVDPYRGTPRWPGHTAVCLHR